MIHTIDFKGSAWHDIENPTKDDVEFAITQYGIDRATAHELVSPSPSPHVEFYKNYLYVVLHFPSVKRGHTEGNVHEVDFILTEKALITARFGHIDAFHNVTKKIETDAIIEKEEVAHTPNYLFFRIIRELYHSLFTELSAIDRWTNDIEKKIFKGHERDMVISISQVSRALIDLERSLAQHREVLETLKQYGTRMFGEYFEYHAQTVIDEYAKLSHMVSARRAIIIELRDTNNSLLSSKQNEASRVIAALALIAVPMSLIVSIFQIDTRSRPLVGLENDFWLLTSFVVGVGIALVLFFKYKKWL